TTAEESARTNRKKSRRMFVSASMRPVVSTITSETDPTSVPRKYTSDPCRIPAAPASGKTIRSVTRLLNQRWLWPAHTTAAISTATMTSTNVPVISLTRRNLKRSSIRLLCLPCLSRRESSGCPPFCSWSQVRQQRYRNGDDEQSGDGAGERPLRGVRDFRDRPADPQATDATGRAGKQGGQDAFGEDVEHVFGLNRARHGVRKQKQITTAFPCPGREQATAREGGQDENNREAKRGNRRAQHPRHYELQEWIASLCFQCVDFPVDFEDSQFGRHCAVAADDHHQVDQHRAEFAGHDGHQQRSEQL